MILLYRLRTVICPKQEFHDIWEFWLILFIYLFFISWRLITLQYCRGFVIHWNESAMDLHVFPIPIPPPTSLSIRFLWVFPVHQVQALVSCIQPGLVICSTLDNIHVSMLFSPRVSSHGLSFINFKDNI